MAELIGMFFCGFFFAFAIMMIAILRESDKQDAEMDAYLDDMADFYDSEYGEDD